MQQVLQNLKTGETVLEAIPQPGNTSEQLLIHTTRTLVSVGTEKMLVDFGKGNLLQKAQQQPEKVRQVLEKVQTDGLMPTFDTVRNKLDVLLPLGYCNVGVARDLGSAVTDFAIGDRVVSNGNHAQVVAVSRNLCAKVPENVDDETAAFTVIGAIALQGIRLVAPTLGETVVVTGLGLVGLVAVQLLRANGCRVLGIDYDESRLALAREFGVETVNLGQGEDALIAAEQFSRGRGVDAVLITASTKSNEPITQAAAMCRKRGRIVLVGVVGMELSRDEFFRKELSFQVSCSYGPGRYDPEYEDKGHDYPVGYVRWTEQRNFEAVLDMMADGKIDVKPLISHRFPLEKVEEAYDVVSNYAPLGVLLEFPQLQASVARDSLVPVHPETVDGASAACLGFIGSGNYTSAVLAPAFATTSARLKTIASAGGVSSAHVAKKVGFEFASTDAAAMLRDEDINSLVITTRHNSHARWVMEALNSGKHVFVEKPLAITRDELAEVVNCYRGLGGNAPHLMVGFNRRYSPLVQEVVRLLQGISTPKSFIMTVNAGRIPSDHWTQDPEVGGGRIIGEGCHFIDLLRYLAGAPITSVHASAMKGLEKDSVIISLAFEDGSVGVLNYLSNGSKFFPKEQLKVFANGGILTLNNFRNLKGFGWPKFWRKQLMRQDKGQTACAAAFVSAVESGDRSALIPFGELVEVANACFDAVDQINGK